MLYMSEAENTSIEHRAAIVPCADCKKCICFTPYMEGSPGRKRGLIGACTLGRAEEPVGATVAIFTGQIPCMSKI